MIMHFTVKIQGYDIIKKENSIYGKSSVKYLNALKYSNFLLLKNPIRIDDICVEMAEGNNFKNSVSK